MKEFKIPKELLNSKSWNGNKVWVYALDAHCIGITSQEIFEWNDCALYREYIDCRNGPNFIRLKFPDKILHFYRFEQKNTTWSVSVNGNNILVVVLP